MLGFNCLPFSLNCLLLWLLLVPDLSDFLTVKCVGVTFCSLIKAGLNDHGYLLSDKVI